MKSQKKSRIEKLTIEVNQLLNDRISSFNKFKNTDLLLRHVECAHGRIAIQPTYSDTFYNPQRLFDMINYYGFSYYIEVKPNFVNVPAPVVHIYDPETL